MPFNSSQRLSLTELVTFINEIKDLSSDEFETAFHRISRNFEYSCKSFGDISQINALIECAKSYINLISVYLTHMDRDMMSKKIAVTTCMIALNTLNSKDWLKNVLFDKISPVIHEILCDPDLMEFLGMEILRFYNDLARNTDRKVREEIGDSFTFYIFKLVDILTASHSYEYQSLILENVFLLCTEQKLINLSKDMFPDAESLQNGLKNFDMKHFNNSARTFLNTANKIYDKVLSVIANAIQIDGKAIYGPMDISYQRQPLWVDFNQHSISIYCEQKSTALSPQSGNNMMWELITIFYDDIDDHGYFKSPNIDSTFIFKIFLKNKTDVIFYSTAKVGSCKVISMLFSNSKNFEGNLNKIKSRMNQFKDIQSNNEISIGEFGEPAAVASRAQSSKSLYDMYQYYSPTSSLTVQSPSQSYSRLFSNQVAADSTVDDDYLININRRNSSNILQCESLFADVSIYQGHTSASEILIDKDNVDDESSINKDEFDESGGAINFESGTSSTDGVIYQSEVIIIDDTDDENDDDDDDRATDQKMISDEESEEEIYQSINAISDFGSRLEQESQFDDTHLIELEKDEVNKTKLEKNLSKNIVIIKDEAVNLIDNGMILKSKKSKINEDHAHYISRNDDEELNVEESVVKKKKLTQENTSKDDEEENIKKESKKKSKLVQENASKDDEDLNMIKESTKKSEFIQENDSKGDEEENMMKELKKKSKLVQKNISKGDEEENMMKKLKKKSKLTQENVSKDYEEQNMMNESKKKSKLVQENVSKGDENENMMKESKEKSKLVQENASKDDEDQNMIKESTKTLEFIQENESKGDEEETIMKELKKKSKLTQENASKDDEEENMMTESKKKSKLVQESTSKGDEEENMMKKLKKKSKLTQENTSKDDEEENMMNESKKKSKLVQENASKDDEDENMIKKLKKKLKLILENTSKDDEEENMMNESKKKSKLVQENASKDDEDENMMKESKKKSKLVQENISKGDEEENMMKKLKKKSKLTQENASKDDEDENMMNELKKKSKLTQENASKDDEDENMMKESEKKSKLFQENISKSDKEENMMKKLKKKSKLTQENASKEDEDENMMKTLKKKSKSFEESCQIDYKKNQGSVKEKDLMIETKKKSKVAKLRQENAFDDDEEENMKKESKKMSKVGEKSYQVDHKENQGSVKDKDLMIESKKKTKIAQFIQENVSQDEDEEDMKKESKKKSKLAKKSSQIDHNRNQGSVKEKDLVIEPKKKSKTAKLIQENEELRKESKKKSKLSEKSCQIDNKGNQKNDKEKDLVIASKKKLKPTQLTQEIDCQDDQKENMKKKSKLAEESCQIDHKNIQENDKEKNLMTESKKKLKTAKLTQKNASQDDEDDNMKEESKKKCKLAEESYPIDSKESQENAKKKDLMMESKKMLKIAKLSQENAFQDDEEENMMNKSKKKSKLAETSCQINYKENQGNVKEKDLMIESKMRPTAAKLTSKVISKNDNDDVIQQSQKIKSTNSELRSSQIDHKDSELVENLKKSEISEEMFTTKEYDKKNLATKSDSSQSDSQYFENSENIDDKKNDEDVNKISEMKGSTNLSQTDSEDNEIVIVIESDDDEQDVNEKSEFSQPLIQATKSIVVRLERLDIIKLNQLQNKLNESASSSIILKKRRISSNYNPLKSSEDNSFLDLEKSVVQERSMEPNESYESDLNKRLNDSVLSQIIGKKRGIISQNNDDKTGLDLSENIVGSIPLIEKSDKISSQDNLSTRYNEVQKETSEDVIEKIAQPLNETNNVNSQNVINNDSTSSSMIGRKKRISSHYNPLISSQENEEELISEDIIENHNGEITQPLNKANSQIFNNDSISSSIIGRRKRISSHYNPVISSQEELISEDIIEATPPIEKLKKTFNKTDCDIKISQLSGASTVPLDFNASIEHSKVDELQIAPSLKRLREDKQDDIITTKKVIDTRNNDCDLFLPLSGMSTVALDNDQINELNLDDHVFPSTKRFREDQLNELNVDDHVFSSPKRLREDKTLDSDVFECDKIREYFDPNYKMIRSYLNCMVKHVEVKPKMKVEKVPQDYFNRTITQPVKPMLQMKKKGKRTLYNESYLEVSNAVGEIGAKKLKASKPSASLKRDVKNETKIEKSNAEITVEMAMEKLFKSQEEKKQDLVEEKIGKCRNRGTSSNEDEACQIIIVTADIHENPEEIRKLNIISKPKPLPIKTQKIKSKMASQNLDEITVDKTRATNSKGNQVGRNLRSQNTSELRQKSPEKQEIPKNQKITTDNELKEKQQPAQILPEITHESNKGKTNEMEISGIEPLPGEDISDKCNDKDQTLTHKQSTTASEKIEKTITIQPKTRNTKPKINQKEKTKRGVSKSSISIRKNQRPNRISDEMVKSTFDDLDLFMKHCEKKRKEKSILSKTRPSITIDLVARNSVYVEEELLTPPKITRDLNETVIEENLPSPEPKIKILQNITVQKPKKPILTQYDSEYDQKNKKIRQVIETIHCHINAAQDHLSILEKLFKDSQ